MEVLIDNVIKQKLDLFGEFVGCGIPETLGKLENLARFKLLGGCHEWGDVKN